MGLCRVCTTRRKKRKKGHPKSPHVNPTYGGPNFVLTLRPGSPAEMSNIVSHIIGKTLPFPLPYNVATDLHELRFFNG